MSSKNMTGTGGMYRETRSECKFCLQRSRKRLLWRDGGGGEGELGDEIRM